MLLDTTGCCTPLPIQDSWQSVPLLDLWPEKVHLPQPLRLPLPILMSGPGQAGGDQLLGYATLMTSFISSIPTISLQYYYSSQWSHVAQPNCSSGSTILVEKSHLSLPLPGIQVFLATHQVPGWAWIIDLQSPLSNYHHNWHVRVGQAPIVVGLADMVQVFHTSWNAGSKPYIQLTPHVHWPSWMLCCIPEENLSTLQHVFFYQCTRKLSKPLSKPLSRPHIIVPHNDS